MRWEIHHTTRYTYSEPVRDSYNELRLQPASDQRQKVEGFLLKILPATRLRHYADFYGNCVHHFEIAEPHTSLAVESIFSVTTRPGQFFNLAGRHPVTEHAAANEPSCAAPPPWPLSRVNELQQFHLCYDFLQESRYVDTQPDTWRLAVDAHTGTFDVWDAAYAIMGFVHGHLTYESASTTVHTHMREVLIQRRGVCQDFAHVMLGLCRSLKIPARYVSGYLATEQASATHAWVEIFIPDAGWIPLDPTHNRLPDENYIKIGAGRDYADVAPVSGTYAGSGQRSMLVAVSIRPILEPLSL